MTRETIDRKAQLVKVATELFSSQGHRKTTVRELARRCDISEPAVYRHFESKGALYGAVLDSVEARMECDTLFESLQAETDIEQLLRGLASHIIDFFSRNEDIHRLLLFAALEQHDKARQIFKITRGACVRFLMAQLDRLRDGGFIIEKNNEITARCFVGMVFECALGQTLWKKFLGSRYEPADVIANNVPIYAKGLKK
jgi:AcrR family transcriptional regulator